MFWGISKHIGNGVRIGVGGRLTSSGGGRKRKGPTQTELAKQEKEEFIEKMQNRMDEVETLHILADAKDPSQVETSAHLRQHAPDTYALSQQLNNIIRRIHDGGNLTAKRREEMMDCVYQAEENLQNLHFKDSDILSIYNARGSFCRIAAWSAIISTCIGLFWSVDNGFFWISCVIFLFSFISWIVKRADIRKIVNEHNAQDVKNS